MSHLHDHWDSFQWFIIKMEKNKYKELLSGLDKALGIGNENFITKDIDLDSLDKNQLYMIHVNLHRFYPRGVNSLSKKDIEELHKEIKMKINHSNFDMLDENDK